MKKTFLTLFKLTITVIIIAFLFARVDLAQMGAQLSRANGLLLLVAVALYFSAIILGAYKWQALVRAQNFSVPLGNLLTYSLVGLFFGNLLPSNVGGDVVRAYDLMRATGAREAAAISVLVDRLMGLVAFLGAAVVMAALAAVTLTRGELEQIEIATVVAATVFIFAAALLFSRRLGQRLKAIFEWSLLAPIRPMAKRVYLALQVYRHSYRALALNLALSASIVIVTTFVWYCVARALGINVSLFYFLLFNPLIAFVLLIPISFNGLGPKEATAVFFFGLVGVPNEPALAMSLIFHLIIVLTSLPGGVLWWRERALAPAAESG
ncbi:MAG: flippase-like domain-containing protein [Chloroflexi bacterium]|nr:flippase-like domain-containing protein [Chloroflexota bacterium]MBI3740528.1 flippase-like domain-containing protein [Chloroflexota bacterium]